MWLWALLWILGLSGADPSPNLGHGNESWSISPRLAVSAHLMPSNRSWKGDDARVSPPLTVIPRKDDWTIIKVREGLSLNISCRLAYPPPGRPMGEWDEAHVGYDLNWYLPGSRTGSLEPRKTPTLFSMVLRQLQMTDSGSYKCTARRKDWSLTENFEEEEEAADLAEENEGLEGILSHSVVLKVLSADTSCGTNFFRCRNGICILNPYVCDGVADCPDSSDEAEAKCGLDPCDAKLRCEDKRCMDPGLCCDPELNENCSYLHPCCKALVESNRHFYEMGIKKRNKDIHIVHSTVYSIVALVFLVTVVVCRIHVRRCRHIFHLASGTTPRQPLSLHDLEVLMHLRRNNHNPFIGIVYNINNGVQMVGGNRNVTPPPPYNQDGQNEPPPPYDGLVGMAHGGFAHQGMNDEEIILLNNNDDDNNNNGDINGNSEMVNQNIVQEQQQLLLQQHEQQQQPPPNEQQN
ncbi:uncharacterized protein LOC131877474 isoform X2 [Tigriopus californicus]|uniref:uncharacterized protein LOC131877474 isoform X2 n=1 Tax=Tigriopus californicus TaxID=6832 RepID=UPI0027DA2E4A|nr:uncharacterized protein LOC131877474 isoform X2 [Tigriopus californicus]